MDRVSAISILLGGILLYAWTECRRSPAVSFLAAVAATAGIYFVWVPRHSTQLAELVGIGRGVDLILYVWVCISLILLLSLHLKLRMQMEMTTMLGANLPSLRLILLSQKWKGTAVLSAISNFIRPLHWWPPRHPSGRRAWTIPINVCRSFCVRHGLCCLGHAHE
jgi:small membrane protein